MWSGCWASANVFDNPGSDTCGELGSFNYIGVLGEMCEVSTSKRVSGTSGINQVVGSRCNHRLHAVVMHERTVGTSAPVSRV